MALNNLENPNRFYVLSYFWSSLLAFTGLIVGIVLGLSWHHFDILFAFVINLPFPSLTVFLSYEITKWIFSFMKSGGQKKQIIMFSMFLFILKYIIVVGPLVIGLVINATMGATIFNPFALVIGVLVYPITTMIVRWYFMKKKKIR